MSLLSIFYSWELIEQDQYCVCEGELYYVPSHGPYQVHTQTLCTHIDQLKEKHLTLMNYMDSTDVKMDSSSKNDHSVFYSPSCCSKPV